MHIFPYFPPTLALFDEIFVVIMTILGIFCYIFCAFICRKRFLLFSADYCSSVRALGGGSNIWIKISKLMDQNFKCIMHQNFGFPVSKFQNPGPNIKNFQSVDQNFRGLVHESKFKKKSRITDQNLPLPGPFCY